MSPAYKKAQYPALGFPRVSGDEPADWMPPVTVEMFSPRERG